MNTYRERLQALIQQVYACYDEVGILRDYSDSGSMKAPLNEARGLISNAATALQRLDNSLPDGHAEMKTNGKGFCE